MRLVSALLAVALLLGTQALASVGCICAHDQGAGAAPGTAPSSCCSHLHRHSHVHAQALPRSEAIADTAPPANMPEPKDGGSCDCGHVQPLFAGESWDLPTDADALVHTVSFDVPFASVLLSLPLVEGAGPPPRAPGEPPGCPCSASPEILPVLTI